jgi:hypothetical protein
MHAIRAVSSRERASFASEGGRARIGFGLSCERDAIEVGAS